MIPPPMNNRPWWIYGAAASALVAAPAVVGLGNRTMAGRRSEERLEGAKSQRGASQLERTTWLQKRPLGHPAVVH